MSKEAKKLLRKFAKAIIENFEFPLYRYSIMSKSVDETIGSGKASQIKWAWISGKKVLKKARKEKQKEITVFKKDKQRKAANIQHYIDNGIDDNAPNRDENLIDKGYLRLAIDIGMA